MVTTLLHQENKDVKPFELYVVPIKQTFYRRFFSQKYLIASETQPFGTIILSFKSIDYQAINGDVFTLNTRWEKLRPHFRLFQRGIENPVAHTDPTINSIWQFMLIDDVTNSKCVLRSGGTFTSLWGLEGEDKSIVAHFSRRHRLFPKSVSEKRLTSIASFEKVAARQIASSSEATQLPILPLFAQLILFSLESHGA